MYKIAISSWMLVAGFGVMGAYSAERAASPLPRPEAVVLLGDMAQAASWSGLREGRLALPGKAVFTVPAGERGWREHGFYLWHDGALNAYHAAGLRLVLDKPDARAIRLRVTVRAPKSPGRQEFLEAVETVAEVRGAGRQVVWLPWEAFNFPRVQSAFLAFLQQVEIEAAQVDGQTGTVTLVSAELARGAAVSLWAPVRGRALAAAGETAFAVRVYNASEEPRAVTLGLQQPGWNASVATVAPRTLEVAPKSHAEAVVTVTLPDRVPPGGRETWQVVAQSAGDGVAALDLVVARDVARPFLLHTPARWDEVRSKMENHAWARRAADQYIARSEKWRVPEVRRHDAPPVDGKGEWLFSTQAEKDVLAAGIAWQLTRNREHAEKVALFWRRLSDPETGYPRTLRACHQELVQEGHFFFNLIKAYDMVADAEVFTPEDQVRIEQSLRLFMAVVDFANSTGNISNWNVAELAGGLSAALVLGDWERADRFYQGPCGVVDQFGKGIMDDGWWYECSTSYNIWMASLGLEFHAMLLPWGENFRDREIPAGYVKNQSLIPWATRNGLMGMAFEKWGPVTRPTVRLRDMLDGVIPHVDWRGIIYAANDSDEKEVNGNLFELAYYWLRDPSYARMIRFSKERDLLWGVPELPGDAPARHLDTVKADNAGMAVLRSQTPGRAPRDRIQAVLKYGSHGGFHGHFDRASLLSVFRHGKSFFNPEMIWYSYGDFMYKFYVQTSLSKNMTVVDLKQQEPVDSRNILFHAGSAMQASVAETRARWTYPPYLGGWVVDDFEEFLWKQSKYLPRPDPMPDTLVTTHPTEPVLQRRALVVLDDCIVVADHLRGAEGSEHTFDHLWQIKGLRGIDAPKKEKAWERAQLDTDPLNSAQLVTDVAAWNTEGTATARFTMDFTPGGTGPDIDRGSGFFPRNEPGILHMNVHNAWPRTREVVSAYPPESIRGMAKRLRYRVSADGETLAEGRFGAWAIGKADIDVDLAGRKTLTLETWSDSGKATRNNLLWAGARWVSGDGDETPATLERHENIRALPVPDADYEGGPIRIAGAAHARALPAEPDDPAKPATLTFSLEGAGAARFRATVGADFPVGPDTWRRRTLSFRTVGSRADFLTVVEPFEGDAPMVASAEADGSGRVRIRYADGRAHEVEIKGLDADDGPVAIGLVEFDAAGKELRREQTR